MSDLDVVLDQYAAVNERDFPRAMGHYTDDVEMLVPSGVGPLALKPGTFKGAEAVGEWFGDWFRSFQPDFNFEIEEARDLDGTILVMATNRGRGRASGAEVHGEVVWLYRLRDGKVAALRACADRADALDAAREADWSSAG